MFGIRWLNIYQHAFHRTGFEKLDPSFRPIEDVEFQRNLSNGELMYVHDILQFPTNGQYPMKLNECTDIHLKEILFLR